MRHQQLLLLPRPGPDSKRHRWQYHPEDGRLTCARCPRTVWGDQGRAWLAAALGSDCYGPLRSAVLKAAR